MLPESASIWNGNFGTAHTQLMSAAVLLSVLSTCLGTCSFLVALLLSRYIPLGFHLFVSLKPKYAAYLLRVHLVPQVQKVQETHLKLTHLFGHTYTAAHVPCRFDIETVSLTTCGLSSRGSRAIKRLILRTKVIGVRVLDAEGTGGPNTASSSTVFLADERIIKRLQHGANLARGNAEGARHEIRFFSICLHSQISIMKINYKQLPIKAHYFFFMAAMGPILPFLPVYGKQLGVSPLVMGSITAILPILFLISKPAFGFVVDYYRAWRKLIFVALLAVTSGCYIFMYFLPALPGPHLVNHQFQNVSCASLPPCDMDYNASAMAACNGTKDTTCHWICKDANFSTRVSFHGIKKEAVISPDTTCLLNISETSLCEVNIMKNYNCNVTCDNFDDTHCLYTSITFWGFVLLMSLGNIGFNVSNCISDAICFDILGEGGQMGYGRQRVWGTVGFGVAAFLAGYTVDLWSQGEIYKTYTPAFLLVLTFTCIDLICCRKLELPLMSGSSSILKDVYMLLKLKPIVIFLCFATLAGILDSFMIYFLFWYLEDLAMATGYMGEIKLIEGLTVAAETLGGEIIFFSLSGKILKKFGYGYTFTFCFVCYALRLGLISLAPTPWWVLPVEFFMQGPTYALCYTAIVAYASAVSPPGTSATVQGIVAGMDDGLGFAVGSLIGGILYKKVGGATTLRIFSGIAALSAFMYLILHTLYLKHKTPDARKNVEWRKPDDAQRHCVVAE